MPACCPLHQPCTPPAASLSSPRSTCCPLQLQAVEQGLKDPHHYVRETAVIGVLKCYQMDPAAVRMRGFLEAVESLLTRDGDPQVVANCLYTLDQVRGQSSGSEHSRQGKKQGSGGTAQSCCCQGSSAPYPQCSRIWPAGGGDDAACLQEVTWVHLGGRGAARHAAHGAGSRGSGPLGLC